jgi:hypothetical protein
MDNNNIMDTNNNITDTNNITDNNNIKSIKKKHSFKKKKKARPILSQHGGAKYDFDNLIGIDISSEFVPQPCWFVSIIQLLWNIDCLRDYLLHTPRDVIINLKLIPDIKKQEEEDNEKTRITELLTDQMRELFKIKRPSPDKVSLTGFDYAADTIDIKVDMILALQSIFKVYKDSIDKMKQVDIAVRTKLFTTAEIDRIVDLKENNLVAILNNNTVFKSKNGTDCSSLEIINSYFMTKTQTTIAEQKDAYIFMELIFLLFEDIDDNDILKIRKCFTCRTLYISESSEYYTIASKNAIQLDTSQPKNSFQTIIDNDYINSSNNCLILFPETKFILLRIAYDGTKNISNTITISNRTYILRGCIVHIINKSGHFVFVAYNNDGDVAALLNDSVKSELLTIKNNSQHPSNDKRYDPATNGVIFLYEQSDEVVEVAKDDPVKNAEGLADALAAAIAVGAEAKADANQPDTNVAAALTATLAATQVGPDAINEPNVPAALTGTLAATQLPASVQPSQPPQSPASAKLTTAKLTTAKPTGSGRGDGRGRGSGDGRGSGRGDGRGRGDGVDDDPDIQQSVASGLKYRAKPPVEENVEVKPYSGSLEPSSDSNGENMVLGILLVITLAISGVLFVQR